MTPLAEKPNTTTVANGEKNRQWIERAHLALEARINDVITRQRFHGEVAVNILIKDNVIIGIDTRDHQTIRN